MYGMCHSRLVHTPVRFVVASRGMYALCPSRPVHIPVHFVTKHEACPHPGAFPDKSWYIRAVSFKTCPYPDAFCDDTCSCPGAFGDDNLLCDDAVHFSARFVTASRDTFALCLSSPGD
ncbi:unnamed protein product [Laminaria digitata]